jgi:hypothetical protein
LALTAFLISIKYRIISMRFDKLSANGIAPRHAPFDKALLSVAEGLGANG